VVFEEEAAGREREEHGGERGQLGKMTPTPCSSIDFETAFTQSLWVLTLGDSGPADRSLRAAKPRVSGPPRPKLQVKVGICVCCKKSMFER
jgi:hypothetical protein